MFTVAIKALIKTTHYDQAWRGFHSWDHIEKGLTCFENYFSETVSGLKHANRIHLAWLLHDAVYIPGYKGNEEASAALVPYYASLMNFPRSDIKTIQELIMQTKGHPPLTKNSVPGSAIINDMDLHGMGCSETYWINGERVKQEVKDFHYPRTEETGSDFEDTFDMNRFQFLTGYYDLIPNLFKTKQGINNWQPIAKECMKKEIVECAEILVSKRMLDIDINSLSQALNLENTKLKIYRESSHEQFLTRLRKNKS
jgi:predicted metal-dependent HD superfamily phosphohydrolase